MESVNAIQTDALLIIIIVSAAVFLFTCVAISIFIMYRILNKFNNFGDTECSLYQYSYDGIRFRVNKDNVALEEKNEFMETYGKNPYEEVERTIPELLIKNAEKANSEKG